MDKEMEEKIREDLQLPYRELVGHISTVFTQGKGFSHSNLNDMRLLYIRYPICETVSHKLSWSYYFELLKWERN